jgi:hypothetical protein
VQLVGNQDQPHDSLDDMTHRNFTDPKVTFSRKTAPI